jgi:hypothetical protein
MRHAVLPVLAATSLLTCCAAAAAAAGDTPHMYRPLFFYVVMEIIELLCWAILACCGFKRYSILVRICCMPPLECSTLGNSSRRCFRLQCMYIYLHASSLGSLLLIALHCCLAFVR